MTYKQDVKELKEKWEEIPKYCSCELCDLFRCRLQEQSTALKAKIEAEGCGIMLDNIPTICGVSYILTNKKYLCPACKEAIKELAEVLG